MRRLFLCLALLASPARAADAVATYLQDTQAAYGADRLSAKFGRGNYLAGQSLETKHGAAYAEALAAAANERQRQALALHWETVRRCSGEVLRQPGEKQPGYELRLKHCKLAVEEQAAAVQAAAGP